MPPVWKNKQIIIVKKIATHDAHIGLKTHKYVYKSERKGIHRKKEEIKKKIKK